MGFIVAMFVPIFIGAFASAISVIVRKVAGEMRDSGVPVQNVEAVVVAKRMHLVGGEHAVTCYYATFELADDRRIELRMDGTDYGSVAEGDRGILAMQGSRFVSFKRTDDRFDARGAAQREHKCAACGAPYTGRACPYCGTPYNG